MGETKNPHFFDFGIFGRVPEPQHQLFFFGDTRIPNKIKKHPGAHRQKFGINLKSTEIPKFGNFRKDGHRQILTRRAPTNLHDPSNESLKNFEMGSK